MRIAVFEVEPREAGAFDALRTEHDIRLEAGPLRADNAARYEDVEAVSTFIYSRLDRAALERLPKLRLVATRSTGYDHIDTAWCAKAGITACNVPSYGENTVAEHVFALLLAISHRLREAMERTRAGRFSPEGLEGFDLQGKTIGVVGTGAIGRHVIQIAHGFGMRPLGYDLWPDPSLAELLRFEYAPLEALYAASDIVSLHIPATAETENFLDEDAFSAMKDGVVIINTARGGLIDSSALVQALRAGKVAAAGLDVLPDEPLIREEAELVSSRFAQERDLRSLVANHVLLWMPNVIVTPHSAFNTREAIARIVRTTVENIAAFAAGRPQNVVAGPPAA